VRGSVEVSPPDMSTIPNTLTFERLTLQLTTLPRYLHREIFVTLLITCRVVSVEVKDACFLTPFCVTQRGVCFFGNLLCFSGKSRSSAHFCFVV
jgi:hypothetical protein